VCCIDREQLERCYCLKNGSGWTALHCAAEYVHVDCVNLCIEMGANVNARTKYGWTPLHIASQQAHSNATIETVVRVLLMDGQHFDLLFTTNVLKWHDC
jgi:ankyrin repeat protein